MTFQQIRYLLEIHKTGSVAAAAKSLYLVPSSLSIAISNLEEELGCKIFDRTRSGMIPTPDGMEVIRCANRIYASYCQMLKPKQSTYTELRILGTEFSPTNTAFVRLMEECKDRTDLSFSKAFAPYRILHQKLLAGEADLLVLLHSESSLTAVKTAIESKGLALKVLKKLPIAAAISPAHRLYTKENLSIKDLENEILADSPNTFNSHRQRLKSAIPNWQERKILSSNESTLEQLVDKGIAFAVGLEFHSDKVQTRGLRFIRLNEFCQILIAVYNPSAPMLPETQRYLELLQEELDK